jgi:hypothetical protein
MIDIERRAANGSTHAGSERRSTFEPTGWLVPSVRVVQLPDRP